MTHEELEKAVRAVGGVVDVRIEAIQGKIVIHVKTNVRSWSFDRDLAEQRRKGEARRILRMLDEKRPIGVTYDVIVDAP